MSERKRIIAPVDGSDQSHRSLGYACRVANALDCDLEIVSVLDLSQADVYDGLYLTDEQYLKLQEKYREEVLDAAEKVASDAGVQATSRLLTGRAIKTLLDEAGQNNVEMIVIGRTGKGFFDRMLQGSVSSGIVAHAPVPVLVVN